MKLSIKKGRITKYLGHGSNERGRFITFQIGRAFFILKIGWMTDDYD